LATCTMGLVKARGCPCPVAGRSRMPSWHRSLGCRLRFAILAALVGIRRLQGTGSPSPSSCPLVGAGWQPAPEARPVSLRRRLKTCAPEEQVVARVFNLCMVHRRLPTCGYVEDVAQFLCRCRLATCTGSETGFDVPQVENLHSRGASRSTGFQPVHGSPQVTNLRLRIW